MRAQTAHTGNKEEWDEGTEREWITHIGDYCTGLIAWFLTLNLFLVLRYQCLSLSLSGLCVIETPVAAAAFWWALKQHLFISPKLSLVACPKPLSFFSCQDINWVRRSRPENRRPVPLSSPWRLVELNSETTAQKWILDVILLKCLTSTTSRAEKTLMCIYLYGQSSATASCCTMHVIQTAAFLHIQHTW